MADKRCENGHFIDASWDICPYCPPESAAQEPEVVKPRAGYPREVDPPVVPRTGAGGSPSPASAPSRTVAVAKVEASALQNKRYVVGWLVGLNGGARGEAWAVRIGRNVLGRSRSSDVCVGDEQASAHHADLVYRPEERRFILMDHNSTNGTYVNGVEIEPRRDLQSRDVVTIGSHRMLFIALSELGLNWDEHGELR